jgi:hypothetical protein
MPALFGDKEDVRGFFRIERVSAGSQVALSAREIDLALIEAEERRRKAEAGV